MRLKVYGGPETLVKLMEKADGSVDLTVVDAYGREIRGGRILKITPNGRIVRIMDVDAGLGFQLDAQKKVKVD